MNDEEIGQKEKREKYPMAPEKRLGPGHGRFLGVSERKGRVYCTVFPGHRRWRRLEGVGVGMESQRFEYLIDEQDVEVRPSPDGSVRFSSWIEDQRARPRLRILEVGREVSQERFARMCAWCKKIDLGGDGWRDLEEGLSEAGLLNLDPVPKITHAVCPECQGIILKEISNSQ